MPTVTIVSEPTESKLLTTSNAVWANVTGAVNADTATDATIADMGVELDGGVYTCRQALVGFDLTTVVPAGAIINSATLRVKTRNSGLPSGGGDTLDAIVYDYGATQTTSDYLTSAEFKAETVVASLNLTSSIDFTWYPFASTGAFRESLTPNQMNRIIISSRNYADEVAPTDAGDVYSISLPDGSDTPPILIYRPRLVVVYNENSQHFDFF